MAYLFLAVTILAEVTGAIASRYSGGFKKLIPSLITVLAILLSYFLFAVSLQYGLHIGIGYAIWAGGGVVLVAMYGLFVFKERLTKTQVWGVMLILSGVAALELGAV
ncbi:DMT family transporter [Paenibacillus senegalensis]|uniref:DMT family transporter n=1 Tax=Paenibacillus senegalensis TaxID=1465766 RepID=UPI000288220A|nr:multidrug efflux SMR transporter [Paenibacillus senegalensis]